MSRDADPEIKKAAEQVIFECFADKNMSLWLLLVDIFYLIAVHVKTLAESQNELLEEILKFPIVRFCLSFSKKSFAEEKEAIKNFNDFLQAIIAAVGYYLDFNSKQKLYEQGSLIMKLREDWRYGLAPYQCLPLLKQLSKNSANSLVKCFLAHAAGLYFCTLSFSDLLKEVIISEQSDKKLSDKQKSLKTNQIDDISKKISSQRDESPIKSIKPSKKIGKKLTVSFCQKSSIKFGTTIETSMNDTLIRLIQILKNLAQDEAESVRYCVAYNLGTWFSGRNVFQAMFIGVNFESKDILFAKKRSLNKEELAKKLLHTLSHETVIILNKLSQDKTISVREVVGHTLNGIFCCKFNTLSSKYFAEIYKHNQSQFGKVLLKFWQGQAKESVVKCAMVDAAEAFFNNIGGGVLTKKDYHQLYNYASDYYKCLIEEDKREGSEQYAKHVFSFLQFIRVAVKVVSQDKIDGVSGWFDNLFDEANNTEVKIIIALFWFQYPDTFPMPIGSEATSQRINKMLSLIFSETLEQRKIVSQLVDNNNHFIKLDFYGAQKNIRELSELVAANELLQEISFKEMGEFCNYRLLSMLLTRVPTRLLLAHSLELRKDIAIKKHLFVILTQRLAKAEKPCYLKEGMCYFYEEDVYHELKLEPKAYITDIKEELNCAFSELGMAVFEDESDSEIVIEDKTETSRDHEKSERAYLLSEEKEADNLYEQLQSKCEGSNTSREEILALSRKTKNAYKRLIRFYKDAESCERFQKRINKVNRLKKENVENTQPSTVSSQRGYVLFNSRPRGAFPQSNTQSSLGKRIEDTEQKKSGEESDKKRKFAEAEEQSLQPRAGVMQRNLSLNNQRAGSSEPSIPGITVRKSLRKVTIEMKALKEHSPIAAQFVEEFVETNEGNESITFEKTLDDITIVKFKHSAASQFEEFLQDLQLEYQQNMPTVEYTQNLSKC